MYLGGLKSFRYLALLAGKYTEAKTTYDKKTATAGFISGTYEGSCHVFRMEDGKYMGQVPVRATNSSRIYYPKGGDMTSDLKEDLRLQTQKAATKALAGP